RLLAHAVDRPLCAAEAGAGRGLGKAAAAGWTESRPGATGAVAALGRTAAAGDGTSAARDPRRQPAAGAAGRAGDRGRDADGALALGRDTAGTGGTDPPHRRRGRIEQGPAAFRLTQPTRRFACRSRRTG